MGVSEKLWVRKEGIETGEMEGLEELKRKDTIYSGI